MSKKRKTLDWLIKRVMLNEEGLQELEKAINERKKANKSGRSSSDDDRRKGADDDGDSDI